MVGLRKRSPTYELTGIAHALRFYCNSLRYRWAIWKAGNPRINLAGEIVGEVTAEEVKLYYETKGAKAQAVKSPAALKTDQPKTLPPQVLEELVNGKMEFKNKRVAFAIDTDPDQVKVVIRLKTWKWQKAARRIILLGWLR